MHFSQFKLFLGDLLQPAIIEDYPQEEVEDNPFFDGKTNYLILDISFLKFPMMKLSTYLKEVSHHSKT